MLFRRVAIAMDDTLLRSPRGRETEKISDIALHMRKHLKADALRAREKWIGTVFLPHSYVNADMATHRPYKSIEDRLNCMASASELPGNLEIVFLSEMINQPLGIMLPDATIKIGEFDTERKVITLRYKIFQIAGQYELLVADKNVQC